MSNSLFQSLELGPVTLENRIVVSPMCQYSAAGGVAGDWHIMHIGQFAVANPGIIFLEGTAVLPEGRISPTDLCLYNDDQENGLRRLAEFVRSHSSAKLGVQLFHSGRKGSQHSPWTNGSSFDQGDTIGVEAGGWPLCGPSVIAYSDAYPAPSALDARGLETIKAAFVESAQRADRAGLDAVEIHYAHGYLLHSFLSPVSNQRSDAYGGSLENRIRFPLEVFRAVREVWPATKSLGARISGSDFGLDPGAWDIEDAAIFACELKKIGCDFLDVSGGFLSPAQNFADAYGPAYQTHLSARIKSQSGLPTIAVGVITNPHQANEIIAKGQADAVAIGRGMLYNPRWPWHAAYALGEEPQFPPQYERAFATQYPDMFWAQAPAV